MSNFWESSHCRRWLVPRTALPAGRDALIETTRWMVVLGCKARMRQRVIATAIVLLRRFALASGSDWDEYAPRAVGVACLYVAAKAEECPMQAKHWVRYASHHAGYVMQLPELLELEMHVLEALDACLVVFHPYRPLIQLVEKWGFTNCTQHAWSLVNDSYHTDLCLLYAPYVIAVAALYVACVLKGQDLRQGFATLQVDLDEVYECARIMMDAYKKHSRAKAEAKAEAKTKALARAGHGQLQAGAAKHPKVTAKPAAAK